MGERPLSEAEIIRRVAERFGSAGGALPTGIGDDAAVLKLSQHIEGGRPCAPPAGESAVPGQRPAPLGRAQGSAPSSSLETRHLLTTDTLIEGVHFDLRYMSLADVGYKALAVNLSDINAMGGASIAALGTLGVPKQATAKYIDDLLDGIEAALRLCSDAGQQCALIGGDTVASPQWLIGFTVLGAVNGAPLLRSGARVGDLVWHTGTLGLSGIGLMQLQRAVGAAHARPADLVGSSTTRDAGVAPTIHRRPQPPLALGPWLQQRGYATAAQDLSDSLSQVALQLGAASGVGIELDFRDYHFASEVAEFAGTKGRSKAEVLLAQAEDYELLFTTPPEFGDALKDAPVECTQVGRIIEGSSKYFDEHGVEHELEAVGFKHL